MTLASALSWAVGNLVIKRLPKVNMLHLMVWASLVPPLPALGLSFAQDGPGALWWAVSHASMWGLFAPVYLGLLATVLAYAIWGGRSAAALLGRHGGTFRTAGARRGLGHVVAGLWRELQHHAIGRDGTSANRRGGHCWAA